MVLFFSIFSELDDQIVCGVDPAAVRMLCYYCVADFLILLTTISKLYPRHHFCILLPTVSHTTEQYVLFELTEFWAIID